MNDNHLTPKWIIEALKKEFGKFDLDPCASNNKNNHFANKNYYGNLNGLYLPWFGKVFVNPPYSHGNIPKWISKAYTECYMNKNCKLVVMLLPSDTSTRWFHKYFCLNHNNYTQSSHITPYWRLRTNLDIRFMNRLNFSNSDNNAKFPSMIVILRQEDSTY